MFMGRSYRFVWVDRPFELNAFNWRWRDFFIIFLDRNVMPGRSDHVYFWAEKRPERVSLQEKCLDVISESMKSDEKEEIKGLGLPRCLEDSLCEMMANLMRRRRLRTASMLQDSLCEITSLRWWQNCNCEIQQPVTYSRLRQFQKWTFCLASVVRPNK